MNKIVILMTILYILIKSDYSLNFSLLNYISILILKMLNSASMVATTDNDRCNIKNS